MPLDPDPVLIAGPGTQVIWHADDGTVYCRAAQPLFDDGADCFIPHWATCSAANQFKRAKGDAS